MPLDLTDPDVDAPTDAPPWELDGDLVGRWYETARALLFHPTASFAAMSRPGPIGPALVYAVIGLVVSRAVNLAVTFAWGLFTMPRGYGDGGFVKAFAFDVRFGGMTVLVLAAALMPLAVVVHGILAITGGAPGGLRQTIRAVAYGFGSAAVVLAVPLWGWLVFLLWGTMITPVALSAWHRANLGRCGVAVLVPVGMVLLCTIVAWFVYAVTHARW
jgi:hypothetical protein